MPYFYLLFFLILISCTPKNEYPKNQEKSSPTPLFVVTRFDTDMTTISIDSLKTLCRNGKIQILKSAIPAAEKILDLRFKQDSMALDSLDIFIKNINNYLCITDIQHLTNQVKALNIDSINFFEQHEKYPFQLGKFDFDKKITRFLLTGVTAIARKTGMEADEKGISFLTTNIINHFKNADITHISNEVSFKPNCVYRAGTQFCTKEEHFQAILDLGADIVELTGNHNRDFGIDPFIKTYEWYQQKGIKTFGGGLNPEQANLPLIITLKDSTRLGFIGFNQRCPCGECADLPNQAGANRYEASKAQKIITETRKKADYLIVSVQFEEVDSYIPPATQVAITHDLMDWGADMVYGSQAHQVQEIEFYRQRPIFHGLGNFLFDQIHRIGVRQGYFLKHYFFEGKIIQSHLIYTFTDEFHRPQIANQAEEMTIRKAIFKHTNY